MSHLFDDIEGLDVIVDDLVVWGENIEQHDVGLRQVLDHCRERNLNSLKVSPVFVYPS